MIDFVHIMCLCNGFQCFKKSTIRIELHDTFFKYNLNLPLLLELWDLNTRDQQTIGSHHLHDIALEV